MAAELEEDAAVGFAPNHTQALNDIRVPELADELRVARRKR